MTYKEELKERGISFDVIKFKKTIGDLKKMDQEYLEQLRRLEK